MIERYCKNPLTENDLKLMMDMGIHAAQHVHLADDVILNLSRCQLFGTRVPNFEWELLFLLDHCISRMEASSYYLLDILLVKNLIVQRALGLILLSRGFRVQTICGVLGRWRAAG